MNSHVTKLIIKFLNHYRANVRDIAHEKHEIVKESQVKIDRLKIKYIKNQINQYDKSGN